jgi:hypothetical protein
MVVYQRKVVVSGCASEGLWTSLGEVFPCVVFNSNNVKKQKIDKTKELVREA